jgi:hypothetical protein
MGCKTRLAPRPICIPAQPRKVFQQAFNNLTPVDIIKEWGFAGLLMVRSYLDRARGV